MDVNVVFKRPGYRVAKRRIMARRIPKEHRMTRDEAISYMKEHFKVEVVE